MLWLIVGVLIGYNLPKPDTITEGHIISSRYMMISDANLKDVIIIVPKNHKQPIFNACYIERSSIIENDSIYKNTVIK